MILTKEHQDILSGSQGETMAKIMKTMVMFGDAFGAEKMVPVTSKHNHLVTSFGLKASRCGRKVRTDILGRSQTH